MPIAFVCPQVLAQSQLSSDLGPDHFDSLLHALAFPLTMDLSPEDAMKAYLHTIQLCKIHDSTLGLGTTRLIEPKYVELLSALAAGNRAKLMVEITSNDISPLTLALAVAAKQTGGRLVCIIHEDHDHIEKSKARLAENDLEDTIDFVHGNPSEVISRYKNIDFAVIDCKLEDHIKLFKTINLNPSGSIVAASNLQHRRDGISFAEVVKGRNIGVKSVTLPIGEGMELTRIRSTGKPETWRSYKRFHVIFEN